MQKDPGLLQVEGGQEEGDIEIDGDFYENIDKLIEDAKNGSATIKRLLTTNITTMLNSDNSERAQECLKRINIMTQGANKQLSLFKL